jgi:hypothetical protein
VSSFLIIVVCIIYVYVSVEQLCNGNIPMSIAYGAYALSNIGLLMAIK